jgi:hypothetical protein
MRRPLAPLVPATRRPGPQRSRGVGHRVVDRATESRVGVSRCVGEGGAGDSVGWASRYAGRSLRSCRLLDDRGVSAVRRWSSSSRPSDGVAGRRIEHWGAASLGRRESGKSQVSELGELPIGGLSLQMRRCGGRRGFGGVGVSIRRPLASLVPATRRPGPQRSRGVGHRVADRATESRVGVSRCVGEGGVGGWVRWASRYAGRSLRSCRLLDDQGVPAARRPGVSAGARGSGRSRRRGR